MTNASRYFRATDLETLPPCVVCGAALDVTTEAIPRTDRVFVVSATCVADVGHNAANAARYGGRLELLPAVTVPNLPTFLLARIAEDEERIQSWYVAPGVRQNIGIFKPAQALAECDAKRRIVESRAHRRSIKQDSPIIASSHSSADPWVTVTYGDGSTERMHAHEFDERFTEPASSDTLKLLALPYADHPDYRQEWKP